ncbi:MAG: hypothetical protein WC467_02340 [Patescibacteria group bacterium]
MQERKNATLIILHHTGDARMLREIEGSNSTYQTSARESARPCVVTRAMPDLLEQELREIGVTVDDPSIIDQVARKHAIALAKRPGGRLAYDDQHDLGLCQIID